MKTSKQVKEDLRAIKYYHSRKSVLDDAFENIGINKSKELSDIYTMMIKNAPPRLFDLFIMLYVKGYTQESLGDLMCYAKNYIYKLNKQLISYFVKEFNKGGYEDAN